MSILYIITYNYSVYEYVYVCVFVGCIYNRSCLFLCPFVFLCTSLHFMSRFDSWSSPVISTGKVHQAACNGGDSLRMSRYDDDTVLNCFDTVDG